MFGVVSKDKSVGFSFETKPSNIIRTDYAYQLELTEYFPENHIRRLAFLDFIPLKAVVLFLEFILSHAMRDKLRRRTMKKKSTQAASYHSIDSTFRIRLSGR